MTHPGLKKSPVRNVLNISQILTEQFKPFWRATKNPQYLRFVCKGGRGSGKSFTIPLRITLDIVEYPISALAIRRVQNTCAKSVMQNFKEAIGILGLSSHFTVLTSKLEIVYNPRGNKIYFAGADDPEKIKSIKDAEFPLTRLWGEEIAEFKSFDDLEVIENSVLREEVSHKIRPDKHVRVNRKKPQHFDYQIYYSYNPPKRRQHWLNKKYEGSFIPDDTYVHHSTYLGNPFLSKRFVINAETIKEIDERRYRHVFLGEPIGSGVEPFPNLEIGKGIITDEMIASFDNIRQGIDFGYGPDPLAFVRWHYDKKHRIIYCIDESYGLKMSNRTIAEFIHQRGYTDYEITADSAEPRTIAELKREYNLSRMKGAKKGPGSVEHGENWLGDLAKIVIDSSRTPNTAWEFENIDYQTDRDGNLLPRLEDKNDHSIAATRYAFERDMKGGGLSILK